MQIRIRDATQSHQMCSQTGISVSSLRKSGLTLLWSSLYSKGIKHRTLQPLTLLDRNTKITIKIKAMLGNAIM